MTGAPDLSHLPDDSPEEYVAAADLSVNHAGVILPLHSAVLAAGSPVLRGALFGGAGAADDMRAAAVEVALVRSSLSDAQTFLRLLYDPSAVFGMTPTPDGLKGVLALAHKLDARSMLEVGWRWSVGDTLH